jgi:hypothetical protein
MRYRKLRIAWSLGCGLLAVLLCVLWVRSYWRWDSAWLSLPSREVVNISSALNIVQFHYESVEVNQGSTFEADVIHDDMGLPDSLVHFRCFPTMTGFTIELPIWSVVLSSLFFAAVPWIRWKFSVLFLVLLTALLRVLLWEMGTLNR